MMTKLGVLLLISLGIAWGLFAGPGIMRPPGNSAAGALFIILGLLWVCAVPGLFLLAAWFWEKDTYIKPRTQTKLTALFGLAGGFVVSYAVIAFYVGIDAITTFHLYGSSGIWALAPFVAAKFSPIGLVFGALIGIFATPYET